MAGPIRGYLYDSEVHRTGCALDSADFAQPAIEGEMALRIGKDGEIVAAFAVVEVHHFVFRSPRTAQESGRCGCEHWRQRRHRRARGGMVVVPSPPRGVPSAHGPDQ